MAVEIRPIQAHDEYWAVEQLQREVWGLADVEIVPNHLLLTAQKNGGLLLGAFDVPPEGGEEQLVGFVFGFVGLSSDGGVKHCSHMAGVAPAYQSQNLGYRLKLAQRQQVLSQGIDLATWTFDPLESRNANLNFRKLGATCQTYLRNLYGEMRNALNVGLPSDRFQVDWYIASRHVADRLRSNWVGPSLSALRDEGIPLLNPVSPGDPPPPSPTILPLESEQLLVQIPLDFQAIKASDMALARAWRLHTRALFEATFAAGYTVVDLLFEDGQTCYLLQKDWMPQ
jgi:predicted GNAT superfamily acetyltransferase